MDCEAFCIYYMSKGIQKRSRFCKKRKDLGGVDCVEEKLITKECYPVENVCPIKPSVIALIIFVELELLVIAVFIAKFCYRCMPCLGKS
jgi:hypothetical protein